MDDVVEVLQVEGGIVVGHDGSKCAQEALSGPGAWPAGPTSTSTSSGPGR